MLKNVICELKQKHGSQRSACSNINPISVLERPASCPSDVGDDLAFYTGATLDHIMNELCKQADCFNDMNQKKSSGDPSINSLGDCMRELGRLRQILQEKDDQLDNLIGENECLCDAVEKKTTEALEFENHCNMQLICMRDLLKQKDQQLVDLIDENDCLCEAAELGKKKLHDLEYEVQKLDESTRYMEQGINKSIDLIQDIGNIAHENDRLKGQVDHLKDSEAQQLHKEVQKLDDGNKNMEQGIAESIGIIKDIGDAAYENDRLKGEVSNLKDSEARKIVDDISKQLQECREQSQYLQNKNKALGDALQLLGGNPKDIEEKMKQISGTGSSPSGRPVPKLDETQGVTTKTSAEQNSSGIEVRHSLGAAQELSASQVVKTRAEPLIGPAAERAVEATSVPADGDSARRIGKVTAVPEAGGPTAGGTTVGEPAAGGPAAGGPTAGGPSAGGPAGGGQAGGGPGAKGQANGGPSAGGPVSVGPATGGTTAGGPAPGGPVSGSPAEREGAAEEPPAGGQAPGGKSTERPAARGPATGGPPAGEPSAGGPPAGGTAAGGPAAGGPVAGGPAARGPAAGGPAAGGPAAGEPAAGGPAAGGPAAGGPAAGGPAAGGPAAGGPAAGGPTARGPAARGPAASGPAARGPAAEGPAVGGPADGGPAAGGPGAGGPAAGGPAAGGPAPGGTAARKPAAGGPVTRGPAAGGPASGEQSARGPAAKEPSAGGQASDTAAGRAAAGPAPKGGPGPATAGPATGAAGETSGTVYGGAARPAGNTDGTGKDITGPSGNDLGPSAGQEKKPSFQPMSGQGAVAISQQGAGPADGVGPKSGPPSKSGVGPVVRSGLASGAGGKLTGPGAGTEKSSKSGNAPNALILHGQKDKTRASQAGLGKEREYGKKPSTLGQSTKVVKSERRESNSKGKTSGTTAFSTRSSRESSRLSNYGKHGNKGMQTSSRCRADGQFDDFVRHTVQSLSSGDIDGCGLERELRKILDMFVDECGFCFCKCNIPKSRFYAICHKLYHHGLHTLEFKELIYMHKRIYAAAENILPGCLFNMIVKEMTGISCVSTLLPSYDSCPSSVPTAQKCCSCKNIMCCDANEEKLMRKVMRLESDIENAKMCLQNLKSIPSKLSIPRCRLEIGDSSVRDLAMKAEPKQSFK